MSSAWRRRAKPGMGMGPGERLRAHGQRWRLRALGPFTLVVGRYRSFSSASGGVHADTVGDGLRNATSPGRAPAEPAVVVAADARPRPAVGGSDVGAAVPAAVVPAGPGRNEVTHSSSEALERLAACVCHVEAKRLERVSSMGQPAAGRPGAGQTLPFLLGTDRRAAPRAASGSVTRGGVVRGWGGGGPGSTAKSSKSWASVCFAVRRSSASSSSLLTTAGRRRLRCACGPAPHTYVITHREAGVSIARAHPPLPAHGQAPRAVCPTMVRYRARPRRAAAVMAMVRAAGSSAMNCTGRLVSRLRPQCPRPPQGAGTRRRRGAVAVAN